MSDINEWIESLVAELKASVLRHGRQAMSVFGSKADVVRTYGECRLMTPSATCDGLFRLDDDFHSGVWPENLAVTGVMLRIPVPNTPLHLA
jgi:hypothetical protein